MKRARIIIDCLMVTLLPVLMAYSLVSETAHEWIGIGMCLLFIGHHILNWRWYRGLTKGRWNAARVWQTVVDFTLLAVMVGSLISGPILSRHALTALPIHGGRNFARTVHMLSAYWGFCLMGLHLGMHWNMVQGLIPIKFHRPVFRVWMGMIAGYGIWAFIHREIGTYMFLRSAFVFFDLEEPLFLFFLDYLAVMVLFATLGFYTIRIFRHRSND